jgi:flagellar basal body P-ring protein FlgI
LLWQFNRMSVVKVKGHTHLVRDLKSQAIVNTDSDAYARYMARKIKQSKKDDEMRDVVREVNSLKTEMREITDLLREIKDGR